MTDITQSDTPVVQQPMVLDEEALKPVDLMSRMMAEAKIAAPAEQAGPKRRGRPPGSRNRSTIEAEQAVLGRPPSGSRMVSPPSRSDKTKPDDELTAEQKRELKLKRAADLSDQISSTVNDNLMLMLTSMGVPSQLLYKPGREPKRVTEDSKYTELAGNICLSPMQAGIFGRFAAEFEATEYGKKVSSTTSTGNGALYLYGLLALGAGVQYVQGLQKFYSQMKPLLEAYQANIRQQQASQQQPVETTGG